MNKEFLQQLNKFVSFKSISTDKTFLPEIKKTVEWLKETLEGGGFEVEILTGQTCNPVVFATYSKLKGAKTVMVYGHYDVQPASIKDGWDADPFTLTEKNGKLLARGVVDNKGQILIHIHTVLNLIKEGKLKYNMKFLIEGNEETSNNDLPKILKVNKAELKCDYILISDGEIPYQPTLEYSLRGGFNSTLTFQTAKNNMHSGIYGGAVPNAAYELSKFLGKLFTADNKVAVPGFYDGVDPITKAQLKDNKAFVEASRDIAKHTGIQKLLLEKGLDFSTQTGLRPTLQITGFKSGYIDEGYANIVPAKAEARINFRVVTSQDPEKIFKKFEGFVKKNTPSYVKWELKHSGVHSPVRVNISSEIFEDVRKLLAQAYGSKALTKSVGGAIPVVSDFKEILGVDSLLVSLGNDDCNMHGANENFDIGLLEKGLKFSRLFFGV